MSGDRHLVAERDDGEGEEARHHREDGASLVRPPIGEPRPEVLFEEQLDAVGERLEEPERTPPVRADAGLHVGDDLALRPHDEERHQQECDEQRPGP